MEAEHNKYEQRELALRILAGQDAILQAIYDDSDHIGLTVQDLNDLALRLVVWSRRLEMLANNVVAGNEGGNPAYAEYRQIRNAWAARVNAAGDDQGGDEHKDHDTGNHPARRGG